MQNSYLLEIPFQGKYKRDQRQSIMGVHAEAEEKISTETLLLQGDHEMK